MLLEGQMVGLQGLRGSRGRPTESQGVMSRVNTKTINIDHFYGSIT